MKVFLSYAFADEALAKRVRDALKDCGFEVWDYSQVLPGDNWGEKLAEALEGSDAMVVLLTPHSGQAPNISYDVGYALGNLRYKGRVVPVIAGTSEQLPSENIPWILKKFQSVHLAGDEADEIKRIAQILQEAA